MTPRQKQVLDFIRAELARTGGVAPTLAEIGAEIGLLPGGVHALLTRLQDQDLIRREPGQTRGIALVEADLSQATDGALLAEVTSRGLLRAETNHA